MRRSVWLGYALMCAGMFMAILDVQIVAAALPLLSGALHIPHDELSWVQTAYLIAEVVAVACSGRAARILSTTGLFTAAVAGFTCASLACALAHGFGPLVAARAVQGLCGGAIIPTVFTAGTRCFRERGRSRALLLAGSVATLAPPLGPLLGGAIAERLAWEWLFLINVPIGIVVGASVIFLLRVDAPDPASLREIDVVALGALAGGLVALMLLLKLGPHDGWAAPRDVASVAAAVACAALCTWRWNRSRYPLIDLLPLREPQVAAACALNLLVGVGLYGSVYALPLFLGFVRGEGALAIGIVMTVTGLAQLAGAGPATYAERRWDPAAVVGFGFALFAAGCALNAAETPRTDAAGLWLPQVLRGAALLFCLLPLTTVVLEREGAERLGDASAVLNLMRNLGGALGIALVDTLIDVRPPAIAAQLVRRLLAGDRATAAFVGLPAAAFHGVALHPSAAEAALARPLVERAAATIAFNDAWLALAAAMLLGAAVLPFLRRVQVIERPQVRHDERERVLQHDVPLRS